MTDRVQATAEASAAYYIGRVKRKLATGVYTTEPVACFCGSQHAKLVTDKDRYGFDHAMWLCLDCGILYANPRMTDETYAAFYANEYRPIYDADDEEAETHLERGQKVAQALKDYLVEQYDMQPAVVFDIGCNAGGWLKPFLDAGAEVHGVDYGPERVALGQSQGLPVQVGSIETLEILGVKADLIIMNHVLEHATNLESTLSRVRGLLNPDGMLYVAVPGLYMRQDLRRLFQNAHPWQFTADTLTYVMECCGFEEVKADHSITSLWRLSDEYRDKSVKPTQKIVYDIGNFLFKHGTRYVPQIRSVNKFPLKERRQSIASTVSRNLPEITELIEKHAGARAVVIGGGPTVDGYVEKITDLQTNGCILISIERMYPWCLKHGITPDYVVAQDASTDVVEAFETIQPGSTYLLAAQCRPDVFDALAGESVYFFHTVSKGVPQEELGGPKSTGVIMNAGGSVVICSLSIAMLMGMKRIHLFGFDCHVGERGYANGIAGVGEQKDLMKIKIDGKGFTTTAPYIAFAQQFFELREIGKAEGLLEDIRVYGDSLVIAMSKEDLRG